LTLGYAILIADTVLAPFTPSNTARSGGTIYPVIRNLPSLYNSKPNDPSGRKIGSYIMWVAIASTCVTSSLFLTGLAPNLLAIELVKKTAHVEFTWMQWFISFAPVGILLLIAIPLLTYWLYPPEIKEGNEVPVWAGQELDNMGGLGSKEITLAVLVLIALAWFATVVALADGLNRVGFVKWFAESIAHHMSGFPPITAMVVLVALFFFTHYMFASVTAHVTAVL